MNPRLFVVCCLSCISSISFSQKLTRYVDPFLGTGGHGHVYPGATVPFGMVQLSPDNGVSGWDWCGGYHYSSDSIAGFSHTHVSGTGIGDWCDISVLPLTDTMEIRKEKIKIPFSHDNEYAKPGFYSVKLGNGVSCSMTASARNGVHQYQFPGSDGWLRFDMGFNINWDQPTDGMLRVINDSTVIGYRYSTGWAKGQRVFFAARFSKPIRSKIFIDFDKQYADSAIGRQVKLALRFDTRGESLGVRVGLSSVSYESAMLALKETKALSFGQVQNKAETLWEKELEKILIDTSDALQATKFYTALYRTCLAPGLYSDADGTYRTHDNKVKRMKKGDKYTIFSLWDTFRALNPLFTITQQKRLPDLINSMLAFYDDNGLLPVWDISTWEANTMTGYHSIPVLADAILKGVKGFDVNKAYAAMKKSAYQQQRGTPEYTRYGYIPYEKHGWSVTYTLEYAFDDWCIAQVAKKLGKKGEFEYFMLRARSYENLFDPVTGFMRAKDTAGNFREPFDPLLSEHGFDGQYIEGTAWQHSFFVPHDVQGLAALYGGEEKLAAKLDELFLSPSVLHGENVSADVTGLIGQYAHGNEPSHHIIYLYTMLGKPEKAAHWIRIVTDSLYKNGPDGLSGNDDCGQMSAWYVWTALGMYPLNPASGEYVFGYPLLKEATLVLPNGKKMRIIADTDQKLRTHPNGYVEKIFLNDKEIPVRSITHNQLLEGGVLRMVVGSRK